MIEKFGTITTEDELYFNTIRTIHSDCVEKVGMNKIQALLKLQLANGAAISFSHVNATGELDGGGGVIDWLHAGMTNFQRRMRENARNSIMEVLFPDGVVFGSIGDGLERPLHSSLQEQEASAIRFIGADGLPYMAFDNLLVLDLDDSIDGLSPDAKCTTAAYARSYAALEKHQGFLRHDDWRRYLLASSWDGASVMIGALSGVAKRLKDLVPHHISVHVAAHIEQLALGDAFASITYYSEWRETRQEVYLYSHCRHAATCC